MNAIVPVGFDYASLPADQAADLRATADQIRRRTSESLIDVGRDLLRVKKLLGGQGQFLRWLSEEFGWTARTAYNFMHATTFAEGHLEIISNLAPTALYLLGSPSAPAAVVKDVVDRVRRGERLTSQRVKSMISDAKCEPKPKRQVAVAVRQVVEKAAEVAAEPMGRSSRVAASEAADLIRRSVAGSEDALSQLLDSTNAEDLLAALREALTKPPMIDAVAERLAEEDPFAIPPRLKQPKPAWAAQTPATVDGAQMRPLGARPAPDPASTPTNRPALIDPIADRLPEVVESDL